MLKAESRCGQFFGALPESRRVAVIKKVKFSFKYLYQLKDVRGCMHNFNT
jgi:hypothetical protein